MVTELIVSPTFCLLHLLLDDKQQQNKSQFGKNDIYFPTYTPRKKLVLFAKMTKIIRNIKIRTVSFFCKKCAKFSKSIF